MALLISVHFEGSPQESNSRAFMPGKILLGNILIIFISRIPIK